MQDGIYLGYTETTIKVRSDGEGTPEMTTRNVPREHQPTPGIDPASDPDFLQLNAAEWQAYLDLESDPEADWGKAKYSLAGEATWTVSWIDPAHVHSELVWVDDDEEEAGWQLEPMQFGTSFPTRWEGGTLGEGYGRFAEDEEGIKSGWWTKGSVKIKWATDWLAELTPEVKKQWSSRYLVAIIETTTPEFEDEEPTKKTEILTVEAAVAKGEIDLNPGQPEVYKGSTKTKEIFFLPVEIVPDFNRDGLIDGKDRGKVTEQQPWHWWINDDDDSGDTDGDDVPGKSETTIGGADYSTPTNPESGKVDGVRDLVDFFPLYLDIKKLIEVLPPGGNVIYKLKHEQGALNYAYTDLKLANVGDFVKKLGATAGSLDNATALSTATTRRITNAGVTLDAVWLQKIEDEGKGVLLIEGRTKTDKPLVVEVCDNQGKKLAEIKFQMSIDGVEKMFRHLNLLYVDNASGGRGDYACGTDAQHSQPENYPDILTNGKNFVFVHGYNVTPEAVRGWSAETFKRMHQSGSRAKFCAVTWHGSETHLPIAKFTPNYHINVDNAFGAAHAFALEMSKMPGGKVVAAHSLGNMLVFSSIHDWNAPIASYFAIDSALAMEAIDGNVPNNTVPRGESETKVPINEDMVPIEWETIADQGYPLRLWASEWYKLWPAYDGRNTLTWRNRLRELRNVNVANFYSVGEEVLDKHPHNDVPYTLSGAMGLSVARYAWALQEKL